MTDNITLTMIKPMAVKKGYIGPILAKIAEGGFRIVAMKYTKLSLEQAQKFYEVHKERPFFRDLTAFMSSGPIVAAILEKENAVQAYRDHIGATNPAEAKPGTIRALYGTDLGMNAVHGSDSIENANIEADFFFAKTERY
ncbi:MAG: nucleoside-diphosphate kinase [Bacteroidales bacterium]|nr:nucleoside-diphosphate kinase [Bacteroidales bacterium]MCF8404640.1 nucleoside-diphosphate kinase [Bacteroidales bacterium]